MKHARAVVAVSMAALLLSTPAAPLAAPAEAPRLAPGAAAFWAADGRAAQARPYEGAYSVWTTVLGSTRWARDYPLRVAPGGHLLRVAFDHEQCCWYVTLELVDPHGRIAATAEGYQSGEAYVDEPAAGTWVVRAVTYSDDDLDFRMRAKLERAPREAPKRTLLPNLRLVPPFEFTFANPFSGWVGVSPPRHRALTCSPDDAGEQGGRHCLRFSVGPANVGAGPLGIRFAPLEGLATAGTAYQRIYDSAGEFHERRAGTFEYHKTHQHYHHSGMGSLELLKVVAPGRLKPVGRGPKQGFCTVDIVLIEWRRFSPARQHSAPSSCVDDSTPLGTYGPVGTLMGISAGWADLYGWSQDGNFVEFGDNGDGRYVVRSTTDALGHILESDETDNTSYAYIEVGGTDITVLERGYGTGPWDPRKRLADDILPELAPY